MQPKNAHALNNTWKRQDTTQDLIVWFSGVMPNPAHAWTVRVADSKGYLGDYDATLQGNRFVIDTGQFADFPVGHYVLEIWETYSKDGKAETGIYPNPDSFVTFDINKNVVDDDLVKSFDLDEVLGKAAARANKAIVVDGTETLPAGSQAAVESRYDGERVHFTFKLPKGADGKDGTDGATPQIGSNGNWVIAGHDTGKTSVGRQGDKGDPPTLRVGSVTKVAPGGTPTASVTGSNGSYAINLGIPEGQQGTGFNRSGIASGTDLNSIKQSGYYSSMGAANLKNVPSVANTSFFNLVVFSDGDTLTQLAMDPNTSAMYMRGCTNGLTDWHPWSKIGGVNDKLDYIVGALATNHNLIASAGSIEWHETFGQHTTPETGTDRFTFTDSTVRGLWAAKKTPLVPGEEYIFRCKIRASAPMQLTQFGNANAIFQSTTITTNWQTIETYFDLDNGLNVYANGKSGDWFEIKDQALIGVGGVSETNSLLNLFPGQGTPTFTAGGTDSTQHLSAQRFSYVYGKECMPKTFVGIRPFKGDTIFQSCIIRISDGATLDSRITFSFFNNRVDHYTHHMVPTTITPIGQNEYQISASYQITEDDFQLKLMDLHNFGLSTAPGNGSDAWIEIDSLFAGLVQSGGVTATNLLQPVSFTSKWGATLTNGISHHNKSADNGNYYDDIHYYISNFEPATHYRLSFIAWGSGSIQTLIYPGAALSENGKGGDGQRTWSLNAKPTEYSYEFDSLAALYGDSQKQFLFRIPSDKVAVDFSLDTSSVVLEKVGGVAKAPSQPQAAGLLYTGSFTVSTGSTPAWAYKAIQVGDMDGDTLTVTLTPHQTAGAKLDQVCVVLYDSTYTKALATYAYPATEQTSTITIVDKWPGTDAQLLFYANDKDINTNTTIEFSNVTIVGS